MKDAQMTPEAFTKWMARHHFRSSTAARALGIRPETASKYQQPGSTIPRTVALACSAVSHGLPPMGCDDKSPETR